MDGFARAISRFWKSKAGNVAIIFGFAALPLLLAGGVALDYGRSLHAKTVTQAALDAGALAAAQAYRTQSKDDSIDIGKAAFAANLAANLSGVTASPEIEIENNIVVASVDYKFKTSLMKLGGFHEIDIGGRSQVGLSGVGKAEVVFVLDYSSSMNDQYEAMRDAAISLVNTITSDQTNENIKIGLVPFAEYVHATLDGDYVIDGTPGVSWSNCTMGRKWPFVKQSTTPTSAIGSKWGRTDGNDTISSDEYDDCAGFASDGLFVRPLSTDHAGTVAQLQAMTPNSGTNVAVGMEFGYHLLSPNLPFDQGAAFGDDEWKKVIILLTDGQHNAEGFGPGGTYSSSQGYDNVDHLCNAAKADGVTVVTVAYELDDGAGKDQMQRCASESNYFLEGTESNIASIFDTIGDLLMSELYLSK